MHCQTFGCRYVDTLAVSTEGTRLTKSPGHIVEHRVIRPPESSIVLKRVESNPPEITVNPGHLEEDKDRHKHKLKYSHLKMNTDYIFMLTLGDVQSHVKFRVLQDVYTCEYTLRRVPARNCFSLAECMEAREAPNQEQILWACPHVERCSNSLY